MPLIVPVGASNTSSQQASHHHHHVDHHHLNAWPLWLAYHEMELPRHLPAYNFTLPFTSDAQNWLLDIS